MRAALAFVLVLQAVLPAMAQEVPLFTTDFPPEEFAARRAAVYDAIGKDAVAVLQGAPSPAGYTRIRQSNEFYYQTGNEVPHAYQLLDGEQPLPHPVDAGLWRRVGLALPVGRWPLGGCLGWRLAGLGPLAGLAGHPEGVATHAAHLQVSSSPRPTRSSGRGP